MPNDPKAFDAVAALREILAEGGAAFEQDDAALLEAASKLDAAALAVGRAQAALAAQDVDYRETVTALLLKHRRAIREREKAHAAKHAPKE